MKITVQTQIGESHYIFEFDENNPMEALHRASVLGNPPRYCTECKGVKIRLDSNKDKDGNIYVNILCKCGAKAKLGQYKAGGYFWHKFERYQKKTENFPEEPPESKEDDIPF